MRDIQAKIAPLIKSMFPSFYLDEGEDFVVFVEAYYEWLESNHQQLELQSNVSFVVGDTLLQGNTTGSVVAVEGNNILVSVNNFDAFRCNVLCDEYVPLTSSSGGNTFIEKQFKISPNYYARKLFEIRDIDQTLDQFIVHFKEKYLKNIEFDTNTNKRLLVKNSFDLYRSKGTERSIDLFFRLVYGASATVYYPGDDIMRLSAAQWFKPQYIEITNSPRTISLVGKQIVGVTSGATAFVEKYIKRRVTDGFVYVLYISNVSGFFQSNELLAEGNNVFTDLPTVVGSLNSLTVLSGSRLFAVGDLVTFVSTKGEEAQGRVSSVSNRTGVVDFNLEDGGWGYTISGASTPYSNTDASQVIISSKVLSLSNVVTSNTLSALVINSGGTGYNNTDTITVRSNYTNASATVNTNASGVITNIHINNPGAGFTTSSPTVTITTSGGTSANITATTKAHPSYFKYFENVTQRLAEVQYNAATNNQLFIAGDTVRVSNSSANLAFATIISNANSAGSANGVLTLAVHNNASFGVGNTILVVSNSSITANVAAITNTSATALVMGQPTQANLAVAAVSGSFTIGLEVFQQNASGIEVANAVIGEASITGLSGYVVVDNISGVFSTSNTLPVRVRNTAALANITNVDLTVGLYNIANTFTSLFRAPVFSANTGTVANVVSISAGSGANFEVGAIDDEETLYLNTDLLSGNGTFTNTGTQSFLSQNINIAEYGFAKNAAGNANSVIFDCLTFEQFVVGSIETISEVNPGSEYTVDPYVLVKQPYLDGFQRKDYVIALQSNANRVGVFVPGERIFQSNTSVTRTTVGLNNEAGLEVGEKVYVGANLATSTANGIIETIQAVANTIILKDVGGTFVVTNTLKSASNTSFSGSITSVSTNSAIMSTGKGVVKSANATHIRVKRIQFDNLFTTNSLVVGQVSGAAGNVASVIGDQSALQIGINADVEANVITANGSVTGIDVIDSGVGYKNNEQMLFISSDRERTGSVVANVSGIGTSAGYYKNQRGQLSSTSKIHDGDFYQEYSYEILSRIPLERYAEVFKKVMHTAGTRFFGGVMIEEKIDVTAAYAGSAVEVE